MKEYRKYDQSSKTRRLEFQLSRFLDRTSGPSMFDKTRRFSLFVITILILGDIFISREANIIRFLMMGGQPSSLTYLSFAGLGLWVAVNFLPKTYFWWINRPPRKKQVKRGRSMVASTLPTRWPDYKNKGDE
ncbi:hypothetical protein A2962_01170 [Candidatus Woesebacteria bacterium RIFCSPLOWO2_01_FULL_39_61]|nr:MAG: hypothetical protein A2692_02045 [Candidatus Woesebacteria bacterium RIFCSPHIGHO2_01_FULL_39_95]OGM37554.1 MAG: hypothetical protein A3E13_05095 [Candidatus Woesebacteria bacterium RIFCSPHIGHO2_12_FULL_40_20]OGM65645.1 MAG: hypothetical protein A2962_01170 [Candidatus Woesebacteria bacterium RIFCSPLOWO2_01_FULL_39_61]OGM73906.1 MAG: hypothetical protein A3H19_06250 [Candidatus Woesebacteria bacterium RIFCSPLOWO2_12_FULL_39_9]